MCGRSRQGAGVPQSVRRECARVDRSSRPKRTPCGHGGVCAETLRRPARHGRGNRHLCNSLGSRTTLASRDRAPRSSLPCHRAPSPEGTTRPRSEAPIELSFTSHCPRRSAHSFAVRRPDHVESIGAGHIPDGKGHDCMVPHRRTASETFLSRTIFDTKHSTLNA